MKKRWIFACLMVLLGSLAFGQAKTKIAIMDFKPGDGVDKTMVEGLSEQLINSLFATGHYTIIERSQIDQALREQGVQTTNVSDEAAIRVGKAMGLKAVVLGTVNKTRINSLREFKIDARIVDVESGALMSIASVEKTGADTFEDKIAELAKDLDKKIYQPRKVFDETAGKLIINYRFDYSKMKVGKTLAKDYVTAYENRDMSSPEEAWTVFTNRIEPAFVNSVNSNALMEKGYVLSNKAEGNYEVVIRFEEVDKNDGAHDVGGEVHNKVTHKKMGEIKTVHARGGKDGIMSNKLIERMDDSSKKFGKRLIDVLQ